MLPHLVVTKLWEIRNHVMHCNFDALVAALHDVSKPEIVGQLGKAMLELNQAVRGSAPDPEAEAMFTDLLKP
jgi:hypothetical protein